MTTTELTADEKNQRAKRKHAAWLQEIETWRADHKKALETLEQAILFVQEHDALLDHHAEAIAEHDQELEQLQAASSGPAGTEDPSAAVERQRLEELHGSVLEQHNRFRGRHPALIQEIARLAVELHKVSHQPG